MKFIEWQEVLFSSQESRRPSGL